SPGLVECDGECVDVQSSSAHCGGCGKACTEGHHCEEGVCVCDAEGETDCDGVCIDLASDVENCGECGNACGEGYACIEGECVVPFEDECTRVLASGITIREIAVFQAGKVPIVVEGEAVEERNAPVIAGKRARARLCR